MYLRILELSKKIEKCGGISGVAQAFVDLRPMAFKADLYRACQLWDTGGLWLDDKIWLTKPFSSFVDVEKDLVVLPIDAHALDVHWLSCPCDIHNDGQLGYPVDEKLKVSRPQKF
jgi:hypothetical protein